MSNVAQWISRAHIHFGFHVWLSCCWCHASCSASLPSPS